MTNYNESIIQGLMKELVDEDKTLSEADEELRQARINFEVASEKFAAVRDVVARHLGHNPTKKDALKYYVQFPSKGRFRFIHMAIGAAVVAALKESDEPMALNEIANAVMKGGLRAQVTMRAVNAALMKTGGIEKTDDDKYRYVEPKEEEEELPFE